MSLVGIFLTILTYALLWKTLNAKSKVPSVVLMHLCVAIGMTDIFAIMAGPARNNEVSHKETKNAVECLITRYQNNSFKRMKNL